MTAGACTALSMVAAIRQSLDRAAANVRRGLAPRGPGSGLPALPSDLRHVAAVAADTGSALVSSLPGFCGRKLVRSACLVSGPSPFPGDLPLPRRWPSVREVRGRGDWAAARWLGFARRELVAPARDRLRLDRLDEVRRDDARAEVRRVEDGRERDFEREARDFDDLVSPFSARILLTVRAATSAWRPLYRPDFLALSLMCSYWRSRFGLAPLGIGLPPTVSFYGIVTYQ